MGSVYPSCLSRNRTITNARGMTTQRRAQTEQPPSEQIEHTPSEQPPSEQHINKTGFSRMRVGLAVDVVSIRTARLPSSCASTACCRCCRLAARTEVAALVLG